MFVDFLVPLERNEVTKEDKKISSYSSKGNQGRASGVDDDLCCWWLVVWVWCLVS